MRQEEIKYSLQNLIHRKLRSFLTVLSILIGVMSIYAIVSFGLGIQDYVDTLAADSGVDKIFIQAKGIGGPGTDSNFYLTGDDIKFIKKIKGLEIAEGMYAKPGEIKHGDEAKYNYVMGFNPKEVEFIFESFGIGLEKGRQLKSGDMNKVVLGIRYMLPDKIFHEAVRVGDKIVINDVFYDVIGFAEEVGNPADDSNVYMTLEAFESLYPDTKDKFGFIMAQAEKNEDPEKLAEKITEKLRKRKGQEEGKENFFAQTFADAIATFGTIFDVINGVLFLIAFISLVVASVNIMNTMYTAVLERTKEIGIMKAIGARNEDIRSIFLFESGLLGILFGYLISSFGGEIAKATGYALLRPIFPWYLTAGCILFAFFIGAIAGVMPAIQASNQKPVDALRYE
jgi:putative ABC transport system permease protein